MEVSLIEADGIPEGCLISVRAGSTRRQAPVEANKPCKLLFPTGVIGANPFKVDLLAPLGNTVFEVNAGKEKYPFEVKSRYGGKSMHVTLRVREDSKQSACFADNELDGLHGVRQSISENLARASAAECPARRHQVALEHRAYLDSHDLLPWVHSLLEDLIRDRPDDPWTFIDATTERVRRKNDPTPEPELVKQAAPDIEKLRKNAKLTLLNATSSGKLEQSLAQTKKPQEVAAPDIEQLRKNAKLTLLNATSSGKLEQSLAQTKKPQEVASPDIEQLRKNAKLTLLHATSSGKLEQSLAQTKKPQQPAAPDIEQLREDTKLTLMNGIASGNLHSALAEVKPQEVAAKDIEQLRKNAKLTLLNATSSGKLSQSLSEMKPQEVSAIDTEQLRKNAKLTLLSATSSGKLDQALSEIKSRQEPLLEEASDLRQQASSTLLAAASSGRLNSILQGAAAAREESSPAVVVQSLAGDSAQSTGTTTTSTPLARHQQVVVPPRDASRVNPGETLNSPMQGANTPHGLLSRSPEPPRQNFEEARQLETLRKMAGSAMLQAVSDDTLLDALCQVDKGSASPSAASRPPANSSASKAQPSAPKQRLNTAERLFKKIDYKKDGIIDREELDYAVERGFIQRPPGFVSFKEEAAAKMRAERQSPADAELEDLRSKAMFLMISSVNNGNLQAALTEQLSATGGQAELDDLRIKAREMMIRSVHNGNLKTALTEQLSTAAKKAELDDIRQKARGMMIGSVHNGTLSSALTEQLTAAREEAELEDIRVQARSMMVSSVHNGNLKVALQEQLKAGAEQAELNSIRDKARAEMVSSVHNGNLQAALREMLSATEGETQLYDGGMASPSAKVVPSYLQASPKLGKPGMGNSASDSSLFITSSPGATRRSGSKSAQRLTPLSSSPTATPLSPVGEEARNILLQDNESMRRENARLRKLREGGDAANRLCSQNDQLRNELSKLMTLHKKESSYMRSAKG